MAATLDEVLDLAKSSHSLSEEQLSRILVLAPDMGPEDLEKLKSMLTGLQEAEIKDMKNELEMRKKVAGAQHAWESKNARHALEEQESVSQIDDAASADAALHSL
jgi:hypothetical protein